MIFLNEYTILGELGKGGFAKVFKVRHNELGYLRAIRVLNEPITDEHNKTYQKFLRECKVLLRLGNGNHRNIVHIYQPRLLENHALVEMDFVDGMDISRYLKENGNYLPVSEVLQMVDEMSSALAYCHEDIYKFCIDPDEDQLECDPYDGSKWIIDDNTRRHLINKYKVIHNDIHSGNIMRRDDGSFVLLDFGLAIEGEEVVKSSSRHDNGAPEYMSPEKWDNETVLSEQSDIYSFGVVMYEYLAGRVPFVCKGNSFNDRKQLYEAIKNKTGLPSISELRSSFYEQKYPGKVFKKDYPEWLEEAILKCLQIDPAKRFRNGKELRDFIISHQQADSTINSKTVESLRREKEEIELKANKLAEDKEALERRINELKNTPPSVVDNPETIKELRRVREGLEQTQSELSRTNDVIKEKEDEIHNKDKEIERLKSKSGGQKKGLTIALSILSLVLAAGLVFGFILYSGLKNDYYRATNELNNLKGAVNNSSSSSVDQSAEVARLEGLIKQKESEIDDLQKQLKTQAGDDATVSELQGKLNTANSTISSLRSQLREVTKERDALRAVINP